MALIEGLEGSGKPLLHTSGSSVVVDNARGDYASNEIFEDDSPFTPVPDKAYRAAIDQLVRDAAQRGIRSVVLCDTNIYGTGKGLHRESVQVPSLIAQARKSGTVRYVGRGANVWSIKQLKVFLALRRVDRRPDADSILEGDLIAALERQGLTCIGRCRDFESQTFDNLPGAMHLSRVAGGQFAWSDP
jgi:nucleoside-diphosphate-sugar epimerase